MKGILTKKPLLDINVKERPPLPKTNFYIVSLSPDDGRNFLCKSVACVINKRASENLWWCTEQIVARDSSVGIVTGYGLDGPGIESRWR